MKKATAEKLKKVIWSTIAGLHAFDVGMCTLKIAIGSGALAVNITSMIISLLVILICYWIVTGRHPRFIERLLNKKVTIKIPVLNLRRKK